jgi:aspartate aminotransferase
MSKCFASTGLRVGWAFGPANVLNKMMAILSHIGAWAPRAEQEAAAIYLKEKENVNKYLKNFSTRIEKRLKACYNGFKTLQAEGYNVDAIAPQAAIYLTIKIDLKGKTKADGTKIESAAQTTAYLLDEAGLAVVPFSCFGAPTESVWFRIAVGTATMDDIDDCFVQLKKALQKLS